MNSSPVGWQSPWESQFVGGLRICSRVSLPGHLVLDPA